MDFLLRERKDLSIGAVGEIIQQLGGYPSASPDKVFSTPSDSKGTGARKDGPSGPAGGRDKSPGGESFALKAKLAALEMEVEALRAAKEGHRGDV